MDSLERQGYFKQQLLKTFPAGRKLFKGLSLKRKAAVVIEQQVFAQSRSAAAFYDEIRAFKALDHPLSAKILDCYFQSGSPSICWTIVKELQSSLEPGLRQWTESEVLEFVRNGLDLFAEAQSRRLYYRNVTTSDFRSEDGRSYRLCEHSGYYFLKTRQAYASPALRRYLTEDEEDLGAQLPFHNPYKSEVYSLGVVALELALGQYLDNLEGAQVSALVHSLPLSEQAKDVLRLLLEESEERRLEPLEMLLWMKGDLDLSDLGLTALRAKRQVANVKLIEARLEEAEPSSLSLKRVKYVSCVGCFQAFRISAQSQIEEFTAIIPLKCTDKNHIFCRQECLLFFAYIGTQGKRDQISTLCCPICNYHLPSDLLQSIESQWSTISPNIDRTATLPQSRLSQAPLHRMSSPIEMPADSGADLHLVSCFHCRKPTLHIQTHEDALHGLCSVDCLRLWGDSLQWVENEEEVKCPVEGCGRALEVELMGNSVPGGVEVVKTALHIQKPQRIETICLACEAVISLDENYASLTATRPVFLYCFPPDHAFCSKLCVQHYVERCTGYYRRPLSTVICPHCKGAIDRDLLYDCYDGEANYQSLVTDIRVSLEARVHPDLCNECRKNRGIETDCGHWFCEECMKGWSALVLRRAWVKLMPCPICGVKIDVEKYRKHSNSMRNLFSIASARMFG